ncbi:hypothetical protein GCM10010518_57430 [Kitasatospora cinereorecta]
MSVPAGHPRQGAGEEVAVLAVLSGNRPGERHAPGAGTLPGGRGVGPRTERQHGCRGPACRKFGPSRTVSPAPTPGGGTVIPAATPDGEEAADPAVRSASGTRSRP